jgi:hypothetical protein
MYGEVPGPTPEDVGETPEVGPDEDREFEDNVVKTMALFGNDTHRLQEVLEAKRRMASGEIHYPKPPEWPEDLDWDRIQQEHAAYEVRTMEEALRRMQEG